LVGRMILISFRVFSAGETNPLGNGVYSCCFLEILA
jgi:hypothetical protein